MFQSIRVFLILVIGVSLTFATNLVVNGDFESWDDANTPTGWTKVENIDQESAVVNGGSYAAKHTGGTKDLGQYIDVVGGNSYTLTLSYNVVQEAGTDGRLWSYWKDASGSSLSSGDIQAWMPDSNNQWSVFTVTATAPADAAQMYFELRTYSGGIVVWDDISLVDNDASSGGDDGGSTDLCADVECPAASGECYVAGLCDSATGTCSDETMADDGTACDDGDASTSGDVCSAGVCTGVATTTYTYDWSNDGTVLGTYGNIGSATNDNGVLVLTESPMGGTPQGLVAAVTNATVGETIDVCVDMLPATSDVKGRIWGHYFDGVDYTSYEGSASGPSGYADDYGNWSTECHTWTYNPSDADAAGFLLEVRLYSYNDGAPLSVDNLSITVTNATVTFPTPPPAETCDDGIQNQDESGVDCGGVCAACVVLGCIDSNATNYDASATDQDYDENGTSSCTYASCADIPTATGCLWDTGQSAEWWEGWWNCPANGGQVCGLAEVVFELDLPDDITGTPHVNGSYNGWCGSCFNDMSDDDGDGIWTHTQYFSPGETHEYKFTVNGWDNQEDLVGLDCAVVIDGYSNRQFTAGDANSSQTLAACWGSCDDVCAGTPTCGDGTCDENESCSSCAADCGACPTYDVTFDIDGMDDCGFVSVTGTWDNWSGWGAHNDNNMTANMLDGTYEYVILCVDTSVNEWWNDIWGSSTIINPPSGSDCEVDGTANYGFTVSGENATVTVCAGSCDASCPSAANLFFSEYGEGSSYNKFLEIYNASDSAVDLSNYQRVNCSNDCDDWEYYTDFAEGATIAAGDVYVICDNQAGDEADEADFPLSDCDEAGSPLYFNGDDAQGLVFHKSAVTMQTLDVLGFIGDNSDNNFSAAGDNSAMKDNTLVRKSTVTTGNPLWLDNVDENGTVVSYGSAGDSAENSEWVVLDQDTWAFIGSHPHDFASTCDDADACNYGETADCIFPQEGFDCDGNVLVQVTFNVDMSEQTVDTEGYGLQLVLNGYNPMSDEDGDGVWSATLTLLAETTYSYKYKNGNTWENNFNDLGCGDGGTYGDRFFTTGGEDQSLDAVCFSSCSACPPPAPTYGVTFNVDGVADCGFVSVTGSFDGWSGWGAHTDNGMTVNGLTAGDYEYTILCVDTSINEWWNDIWGSSTQYFAPAECDFVPGDDYANYGFTVTDSDMTVSICAGSCGETCVYCSYDGNVNGDDVVNVSDVVMIVGWIIGNGTADACTGDVNEDGVVNVSDVVMIVGWIIGGRADIDDATNANIVLSNNNISIEANGQVSGVQMTLSHGNDFSIDLADAFVSEYSTNGNTTKLVVVSANSSINHIASCKGSFNVDSAIVVNSNQEIADVNILNLEPVELTLAGPNPFNPTTSLNVVVANDGYVSVNVYNITGQHIATLLNGYMDANTSGYMVNWNASNLSSGVYLVRAETAGSVSTQKLMLLK